MVTCLKYVYYEITSVEESVWGAHPFSHPQDRAFLHKDGIKHSSSQCPWMGDTSPSSSLHHSAPATGVKGETKKMAQYLLTLETKWKTCYGCGEWSTPFCGLKVHFQGLEIVEISNPPQGHAVSGFEWLPRSEKAKRPRKPNLAVK